MNIIKKLSAVLLSALIIMASGNAQEKINLTNAITSAVNKNTSVVKSTNSLNTSNAAVKNAYGSFIPSFGITGGWSWQRITNNEGTAQLDYLGNTQNVSTSSTDSRSYNLSAGGNFTLFDGLSNIASLQQAKNNLQTAKLDLEKLKQDVILQTVNLYMNIINYDKVKKFQEEDLKYNQDLLNRIKAKYDLKIMTSADLSAQEYQTANAKLLVIQSENNLEKAKISLLTYLSKDVSKEYEFDLDNAGAPETADGSGDLDELYRTAFQHRNDYQSEKLKVVNSEYQMTISKSGLYPSLTGNYGLSTSAVQLKDIFSRKVYSLGVSLNIPIFSHFSTEYSIEAANVQIKNSKEDLSAMERQVKSDVKTTVLDVQSAKSQLDVAKSAVKSAKEAWDVKKEKFLLGLTSYIEQQQAYRDYVQAVNNQITAECNYSYKQYSLLNALGMLKSNVYETGQ
jgi:outer membrane protein